MKSASSPPNGRGRPREFDLDAAIDDTVEVFRQRGYLSTTVTDLTEGTGLSRGSFYKAFVDKPSAFLLAFERYASRGQAALRKIASGDEPARERLRRVLQHYVRQSSGTQGRLGCLVVATATETTLLDAAIRRSVEQALSHVQSLCEDLIRAGIADRSLPRTLDPSTSACALLCLVQGLRVLGKSDRHRAGLGEDIVELGMKLLA